MELKPELSIVEKRASGGQGEQLEMTAVESQGQSKILIAKFKSITSTKIEHENKY